MQSINHKSIFQKKLLTLFFSAFLIVGFFLVKVENTFADSIILQNVGDTTTDINDSFHRQRVGNGWSFTMYSAMVVVQSATANPTSFGGNIREFSDSGYSSQTNEVSWTSASVINSLGGNLYEVRFLYTTGMVFDASKYYQLSFVHTDSGTGMRGSASDTMPGGSCQNGCGSVADLKIAVANDLNANFTPPDTSTRIDTFTYATSTRIANVTGYWNTHASSTERLSFWQSSVQLGQESYKDYTATTTGAFNFSFEFLGLPTPYNASTTTAPFVAPYTLHAVIEQRFNDFNVFSGEGTPPVDLAATSTVVSTLTYGLKDFTTGAGLQEYPEYECGISSITGCLKNAGIWLFYPSSDSVERFKSLSDTLSGKFPFAYVYGMNTMRNELFESAQTATTTISLNFKIIPGHATSTLTLLSSNLLSNVPYANTVKTIVGFILWLMAAEYVYYRVLRSHDPNTPQ